jgi:uncharacterized repeat protein (TIGR03837 family)
MAAQRYDIFCKVVDNYGDAGVSWRLARQLVREHGMEVTLWIDALASLARIADGIDASRATQASEGVRVCAWREDFARVDLPDVVVEAFGCGLPDRYLEAMAASTRPPLWINLEYLSAEPWVESAHGLPSPQPRLPLTRYFYFPGFTPGTAGLLREAGLIEARKRAQADPAARAAIWQRLRVATPPNGLVVSLFCYATEALPPLLDAWAEGDEAIVCLAPEGVATPSLDAWTGGNVPHAGQSIARGRLTLMTLPFVAQDAYDQLLWQCDVNIVRGEDSFVRAQWAARPFVWHIYPQADDAHRVKLDEFLRRFEIGVDPNVANAINRFWSGFNDHRPDAAALAWPAFREALPGLAKHGSGWADRLARQRDLATGLVDFCASRL